MPDHRRRKHKNKRKAVISEEETSIKSPADSVKPAEGLQAEIPKKMDTTNGTDKAADTDVSGTTKEPMLTLNISGPTGTIVHKIARSSVDTEEKLEHVLYSIAPVPGYHLIEVRETATQVLLRHSWWKHSILFHDAFDITVFPAPAMIEMLLKDGKISTHFSNSGTHSSNSGTHSAPVNEYVAAIVPRHVVESWRREANASAAGQKEARAGR